jgi:hypothetical protein
MQFKKIDGRNAVLYQPATPLTGLESHTQFSLIDPYYIDIEFRCSPQNRCIT